MRRTGPIALGILTLLAVGLLCLMALRWVKAQRGLQEELTARDVIHEQVKAILMSQGVLKMAARFGTSPGNAELAHCVLKGADNEAPCTVTSPAEQVSFALAESRTPGAKLIAGDAAQPAPYGRKGALGCEAGDDTCPGWQAVAWFWADCPDAAKTCDVASNIHVRIQVQGVGALAGMASNPPEAAFLADPAAFAETIAITAGGVP